MLMTYFIDNTLDTKHHHNIKVVLLVFYIILGLINARKMEHIRKIEIFFSGRPTERPSEHNTKQCPIFAKNILHCGSEI